MTITTHELLPRIIFWVGILRIFDDQMLPEPTVKDTKAGCVFYRTHQPTPHPPEFHPFYLKKKRKLF